MKNEKGVEIVYSKYAKIESEKIFKLFFVENKKALRENDEGQFEFDYNGRVFKVVYVKLKNGNMMFSFQEISKFKEFEFYRNVLEFIKVVQEGYLEKLFSGKFTRKDWKFLLKNFVKSFPNVDSASLILKDKDGYFRYIAAYNHDMRGLKALKLRKEDFVPERFEKVTVIKLDEIVEEFHFSTKRREKIAEKLTKFGNLTRIKSLISIPIFVDNECIGFLVADSWEREDAFDRKVFEFIAGIVSNILSDVFQKTDIYEKSFV